MACLASLIVWAVLVGSPPTGELIRIAGSIYVNARLAYTILDEPRLEVFGLATNLTGLKIGEGIHAEMADDGVSRVGRRFLLGLAAEL